MPKVAASRINARNILAVDDDPAVLRMMGAVLQGAGYRVLLAGGGRPAVELYESSPDPVHLLVTDVVMPDLTGPVLAARLRQKQPDLRVLFISGFHDADLVQRIASRNHYRLLPKPFTMEVLLRVVSEALAGA